MVYINYSKVRYIIRGDVSSIDVFIGRWDGFFFIDGIFIRDYYGGNDEVDIIYVCRFFWFCFLYVD